MDTRLTFKSLRARRSRTTPATTAAAPAPAPRTAEPSRPPAPPRPSSQLIDEVAGWRIWARPEDASSDVVSEMAEDPATGELLAIERRPGAGRAWTRGGRPASLGELIEVLPHRLVEWAVGESIRAMDASEAAGEEFGELDDDLTRLAIAIKALMRTPAPPRPGHGRSARPGVRLAA